MLSGSILEICVLEIYDSDLSGEIDRIEAADVVTDFLLGLDGGLGRPPARDEAIDTVTAYLLALPAACTS